MPSRFNELLKPQEYVSTYVPLPLDLINQAGAAKQKVQDAGIAEKESYMGKTWNRIIVDAPNARELKAKHDATLEEFSNKDFNDPNVKAKWYKTKIDMANDLGPDGMAGAQESNYNKLIAQTTELDKALSKKPEEGGVNQITHDYILKKGLDEYNAKGGVGEKTDNGYNSISFDTPVANPNIGQQVLDATAGWKPDSKSGGYWNTNSGQWMRKTVNGEEAIDPKEIQAAILPLIMQRPENLAYAKQQIDALTYGKDVSQEDKNKMMLEFFTTPVNASAARLGYKSKTHDESIQANADWENRAKEIRDKDVTVISNNTQVESLTAEDFSKNIENIKVAGTQIAELQAKLKTVPANSREAATYNEDIKNLTNKKSVLESNQLTMDNAMKASKHTQDPVIEGVLLNSAGNEELNKMKVSLIGRLRVLPGNLKTTKMALILDKINNIGLNINIDQKIGESDEELMTQLIVEAKKVPGTLKILDEVKDKISKRVNESDDSEWRGPSGLVARALVSDRHAADPFGLAAFRVNELRSDYAEDNNKLSIGTSTLTVDPKSPQAEQSIVNNITNAYKNDLQHNTNYLNFAGNSLSELVQSTSAVDSKGTATKLDVTKASPLLTYKPINGKFYMNVVFDDAFDSNGNAISKLLAPENQKDLKDHLNVVGNELMKSESASNRQKGFEVLSNVAYGGDLSVVNPALMSNGQQSVVTINVHGNPITLNIKKVNDHIEVHDQDGKSSLYRPDNSIESDFSGIEELSQAMYYTNDVRPNQEPKK